MLKIKISLFIFIFGFLSIFSQNENINNYKYIIVPEQFEFQKSEDSFQINSLTKFLFNKYGFNVLMSSDKYPDDLSENKCLALTTRMNNNSGFLGKKINFDLVNCSNEVVYSSKNGISKEKEFKRAFQQAIRNSFESLKTVNYEYKPIKDVVFLKEEPVIVEAPKEVEIVPEIIPQKEPTTQNSPIEKIKEVESYLSINQVSYGFNILDENNKLLYELQETSVKNVYIAKGIDGILFKTNGKWILEYYVDGQFLKKELNIKL